MKTKLLLTSVILFSLIGSLVVRADDSAVKGPAFYQAAVRAGDFLFVSGQNAQKGDEVLTAGISGQTKAALELIKKTLKQNGYGFEDVVNVNVFMAKQSDFAEFNVVYHQYFPNRPARSTSLGVLHQDKGALVEISLVAYKAKAE